MFSINNKSQIINGDCLEVLKTIPDNSLDACVTDPPYEIGFMGKSWDNTGIANNVEMWAECLRVLKPGGHLLAFSGTRTYHRMASAIEDAGFEVRDMIEWVYSTGFPKSLNVYKQLQKQYGTEALSKHDLRPLPETDLSQTELIKKEQGKVLQSGLSEQGIPPARRQKLSTTEIREEQPSVEGRSDLQKTERKLQECPLCEMSKEISSNGEEGRLHNGTQVSNGETPKQIANKNRSSSSHRPQSSEQRSYKLDALCKQHLTQEIRRYDGIGTSLKPAHEPICMARKPLAEKTVAENVLKYGTGGINIDESRVEAQGKDLDKLNSEWDREWNTDYSDYADKVGGSAGFNMDKAKKENAGLTGRFPANLILEDCEEVRECFPETNGGSAIRKNKQNPYGNDRTWSVSKTPAQETVGYTDSGNASRFFKSIIYQAKASKSERNKGCEGMEFKKSELNSGGIGRKISVEKRLGDDGINAPQMFNNHPTVKPIALMEYLIKMVTPKGGIVLDPFAGSGSTLVAAKQNGFGFVGIEKELKYVKISEARISAVINTLF